MPLGPTLAALGPRPGSIPIKLRLQSDGAARSAQNFSISARVPGRGTGRHQHGCARSGAQPNRFNERPRRRIRRWAGRPWTFGICVIDAPSDQLAGRHPDATILLQPKAVRLSPVRPFETDDEQREIAVTQSRRAGRTQQFLKFGGPGRADHGQLDRRSMLDEIVEEGPF